MTRAWPSRPTEPAIAAILDGLTWLGLDWDGEPVSQYARGERHREVVETLLAAGNAYRCYCTAQELEAMRARALAEGRSLRYEGTWRDRDPAEAPADRPYAIRFRAPDSGETVIDDLVQGRVMVQNKDLDDLIILRSDGSPTYNLSVVVDDHDMGVTHVIRGVDHLTNAARQTQVYNALGWPVPLLLMDHMDDPASPHTMIRSEADFQAKAALSARRFGVTSYEEYCQRARSGATVTVEAEKSSDLWKRVASTADQARIDRLGLAWQQAMMDARPRFARAIDSEGDLQMSMGVLLTVAEQKPANFYHFMLDNECYATTGGQPVPNAKNVKYDQIALGAGYPRAFAFDELGAFEQALPGILGEPGPVFVALKVHPEVENEAIGNRRKWRTRSQPQVVADLKKALQIV